MFRVTRYPMISKTESGRVGYQEKYRVAGRVWVPAGHCCWFTWKGEEFVDEFKFQAQCLIHSNGGITTL